MRRLAAKTVGSALALTALAAMSWADVILVRHFAPHLSGLYGALSIVGRVIVLSVAFMPTVLLPKVAQAGNDPRGRRALLRATLLATAFIGATELLVLRAAPRCVLVVLLGGNASGAAPYGGVLRHDNLRAGGHDGRRELRDCPSSLRARRRRGG